MHIATVGSYPVTIGWLIALIVLLLAMIVLLLGLLSVVPSSPLVVFGLIGALAVARLT
jgi:hypothetical protein